LLNSSGRAFNVLTSESFNEREALSISKYLNLRKGRRRCGFLIKYFIALIREIRCFLVKSFSISGRSVLNPSVITLRAITGIPESSADFAIYHVSISTQLAFVSPAGAYFCYERFIKRLLVRMPPLFIYERLSITSLYKMYLPIEPDLSTQLAKTASPVVNCFLREPQNPTEMISDILNFPVRTLAAVLALFIPTPEIAKTMDVPEQVSRIN